MFVILGATGHIGTVVVETLLAAHHPVLAVTRDADRATGLRALGAEIVVAEIGHSDALRDVLRRGRRAFLLNPPAAPSSDTDAEEHRTAHAIAAALDGSALDKVVVASTYGAQPGEAIGDLSTLYDFEQSVGASGIPAAINRAAYYYTNFDPLLPAARAGTLPTMFLPDIRLPMVAPADLGRAAARRLVSDAEDVGITYVEGPARHSFAEVAAAFAAALGRPVEVKAVPRERWEQAYREQGFSSAAARAYARMTAVSVDSGFEIPDEPERGSVALEEYVAALVRNTSVDAR